MTDSGFEALLTSTNRGVLTTIKAGGRPHLSNVNHHYDPAARILRVSLTDDRAKTRNLRRDPRVSYYVTAENFWHWVVAEGTASLSPVAAEPGDDTVEELIEVYRSISGEHPDWDDYRRAMVADRRLVFRMSIERFYGQAPVS